MILNYLKLSVRLLLQKKTSSVLSLSSLVVGLFGFLFVSLYVHNELTFDRHFDHPESIYRIVTKVRSNEFSGTTAKTSLHLKPIVQLQFPEKFQTIARLIPYEEQAKVIFENKVHRIRHIHLADAEALRIFSYHFIEGSPAVALQGPSQAVLSKHTATQLFGAVPALGKVVEIDHLPYQVTGVMEDLPANSDLPVNGLLSLRPDTSSDWTDWKAYTYIKLPPGAQVSELKAVLKQVDDQYVLPHTRESGADLETRFEYQPLRNIHFTNDLYHDTPKGNRSHVYFLTIAGLLLLIITCFNYVNLSIARSLERRIEVGIRKVLGAYQGQLVRQYLWESLVATGFAFAVAVMLLAGLLPLLNRLTDKQLSLYAFWSGEMLATVLLLLLVVGIFSAIYPALFLSAFDPGKILQGQSKYRVGSRFKDTLLVAQFAVSIGMIIGTLFVSGQLNYLKNKDNGFQRESVLVLPLPEDLGYSRVLSLKNELEGLSSVKKASVVGFGSRPGSENVEKEFFTLEQNNRQVRKTINCLFVDENFLDVLGIPLASGTRFTGKNLSSASFLVNETLVKQMGWKNPIGQRITWQEEGEVIGVVKDYHYQSLYNPIEPLILIGYSAISKEMLIKISQPRAVELIREKWNQVVTGETFDLSFLDENLDLQYRRDERMLNLFAVFSLMTAALAFMGLFALSHLHIQQRIKEIGIRRVMGATSRDLISLFSKKTLGLIFIAFLIAAPWATYLTHDWSQQFVYRKGLTLWPFVISGSLMGLLALATVAYNVWMVARQNPVDALRNK
jgi:putative ABC transport system permease protein